MRLMYYIQVQGLILQWIYYLKVGCIIDPVNGSEHIDIGRFLKENST